MSTSSQHQEKPTAFAGVEAVDGLVYAHGEDSPELRAPVSATPLTPKPVRVAPSRPGQQRVAEWQPGGSIAPPPPSQLPRKPSARRPLATVAVLCPIVGVAGALVWAALRLYNFA